MSESDPFFVPTRSSKAKKSSHEVIIYESQKKKESNNNNTKELRQQRPSTTNGEEITMKKARFEVYKFAHSALSAPDKQKSNIELAIKLGAKPPKNKYMNYRLLKENKKKEIEEAKLKNELYNIPIHTRISEHKSKLNKGTLRRKRKIGSGILNVYGKVRKVPKSDKK